jgi:hypothetical protein
MCIICNTCATLLICTCSFSDRRRITRLHALHRTAYMGERTEYASRRLKAYTDRSQYLSVIGDGMAQSHCILPLLGNLQSFSKPLDQHLQGLLFHNRELHIYRTFHNIQNCSSLAIHCFLLSIEYVLQNEEKLPETLYYQIDGGGENTARCWFVLCELLVAKGLFKRIILTRLMVGHTHEDIDSVFGVLWKNVRTKFVLTPDEYKKAIEDNLSKPSRPCHVFDIFCIPDYKTLLEKYMDPKFVACVKKEKTQLQWKFEAVEKSIHFPNGVKTMYRAYSRDVVAEVIPDAGSTDGFTAQNCFVRDYPHADESRNVNYDGLSVIVAEHGYHIPLQDKLFISTNDEAMYESGNGSTSNDVSLPATRSTDCVTTTAAIRRRSVEKSHRVQLNSTTTTTTATPDDEDSDNESMDYDNTLFKVGSRVRNEHGLEGVVMRVYQDEDKWNRHDVKYKRNCDNGVYSCQLGKAIVRKVAPRKKARRNWEMVSEHSSDSEDDEIFTNDQQLLSQRTRFAASRR